MMMTTDAKPPLLLLVDDEPSNIDLLAGILKKDYRLKAATAGVRAIHLALSEPKPDLILLDVMMPGLNGYDVLQQLQQNPLTKSIPVIFITGLADSQDEFHGFDLGAVDYITKPVVPQLVRARVKTHLALSLQNRELEHRVRERTAELEATRLEIIRRLARAAELRDNETGLHVIRMSHYSKIIAETAGAPAEWCELLFHAAPMHDVGKIGIPDHILLKPMPLDFDEWQVIRMHPELGVDIIGDDQTPLLAMSRDIALCHHEKWNGSGYPAGRVGEEIPLSARIVAIADVFDALTSARPYKEAWSLPDTLSYMDSLRGSAFDPALLACFHQGLPRIIAIMQQYSENAALGDRL